ncbi:MAG: heavy-metal-associated domain-containing protein [Gammaproteobacteria bacterium]|nr:heavy-metal-associated domain-containing protein [Gammaproteobacteria bacterium]MCW8923441.1 heavy-metal-associated domain-containing protein [Gammaproteobacteria bacterium]
MNYEISVENIKCGGCAGTIVKKVTELDGVDNTKVDIETGIVKVEGAEGLREALVATLLKHGYPETGTTEGMAAAKAKAKSFVSCAVGRINADK